jgi:16S rRNA (guanine966-N2)-methyltransferase
MPSSTDVEGLSEPMKILAGEHRGRTLLPPPKGAETRPITGLARKSLFSILGTRVVDAHVLDLFCGTGTLGLEALSQGASRCCFADRDRAVLARLRRNIETLGVGDVCTVWSGDVLRGLQRRLEALETSVDLAFVDPPYAASRSWDWGRIERSLLEPIAHCLSPGGVLVFRSDESAKLPHSPGGLTVARVRKYGNMVIALLTPPGEEG